MPQLLTKSKREWANKFKPNMLRGSPLNPNVATEIKYYNRLAALIERMTAEVEKHVKELFSATAAKEYFAEDASIASQARILTNAFVAKFDDLFAETSQPIADQMVAQADKNSSAALHMSLKDLSGGLSLPTSSISAPMKEIIKAATAENVQLIKSIPQKYLTQVQGAVMRSITQGNGLQDLVPFLAKQKGITLRRARFIAIDQTRKTFNALSEGRCEALGLDEGEWLHTGGSRHPRPTHVAMTGKIFKLSKGLYDSAVKRYVKPGQEPGCRCRFLPVIKFKDEK